METKKEIKYYKIARIVGVKGLTGALKVLSDSDNLDYRFQKGKKIYIQLGNEYFEYIVSMYNEEVKNKILILENISSIDDAMKLVNKDLFVDATDVPPLDEFTYLIDDLISKEVYNTLGEYMGVINDVLKLPTQDVLEIKTKDHTFLVPFVPFFVKEINDKFVVIEEIEGLR